MSRRRWRPLAGRTAFTSRSAVLGLVLCALVLTLAYPLRIYLDQRGEINRIQSQQVQQQQRVAALHDQVAREQDPAYIEAQARQRLRYVLPGETAYILLDGDQLSDGPSVDPSDARPDARRSWFGRLWGSVERAGSPSPAAP